MPTQLLFQQADVGLEFRRQMLPKPGSKGRPLCRLLADFG
jgi:hypothetical protein